MSTPQNFARAIRQATEGQALPVERLQRWMFRNFLTTGGFAVDGHDSLDDPAPAQLVQLFDQYHWQLDERTPCRNGTVTPAALGAILEQQAGRKQQGAYYTESDITEYICRSTIIPAVVGRGPGNAGNFPPRSIEDLITRNCNLPQFALDRIAAAESAVELLAWWQALSELTVLDPTCGAGAFLLAALDVLEPLYATCLDRMQALLEGNAANEGEEAASLQLREIISNSANYPSREYFIVRSILVNNLFGVDLSPAAVQSCKLRLTLRLLSTQSSRKGSGIFGEKRLPLIVKAIFAKDSRPPHAPDLDNHLHQGDVLHRPAAEFPEPLARGGFDVVLGNPPFVEYSPNTGSEWQSYRTHSCGNLYALVTERSCQLLKPAGWLGLIMPAASVCTPRMAPLEAVLHERFRSLWTSLWDERPSKLFAGVDQQLAIHIGHGVGPLERRAITAMRHWHQEERPTLFATIAYVEISPTARVAGVVPKISSRGEQELLAQLFATPHLAAGRLMARDGPSRVYYRNAGGRYWRLVKRFPSYFASGRGARQTSTECSFAVIDPAHAPLLVALFSSSLYYWFWRVSSNCRHLTDRELHAFPVALGLLEQPALRELTLLADEYESHLRATTSRQSVDNRRTGRVTHDVYYVSRCKPILDLIDGELATCYGLSAEQLEFVINYDIKYRMGGVER